jgi:hypothetical protein
VAGDAPVELSVDAQALKALGAALAAEGDGKKLRRDLTKGIRKALDPAVGDVRSSLMSMGTHGLPTEGEPLRQAVARKVKVEARLSGRSVGARLKVGKSGMPRGFRNAPARLNAKKGWRRRLWGRDQWVVQHGKAGWFDDVPRDNRKRYRAAVLAAMNEAAKRITRGAR